MRTLTGKTAVVTGAASGIGLATAQAFAQAGMRVVLADLPGAALDAAAAALRAAGTEVQALPTDVSDARQVEALAQASVARFGSIDVVMNNAGICGDLVQWSWQHRLEDWQRVLDVNLYGVIHGIRSFVPILLRQKTEAHIVNTASMGGLMSPPYIAPYVASKAAVVGISEALATELRQLGAAIGVSVACPGSIRTGLSRPLQDRAGAAPRPPLDAAPQAFKEAARAAMEQRGLEPAVCAQQILSAVREHRFYVFTHAESLGQVERRWSAIRTDFEGCMSHDKESAS